MVEVDGIFEAPEWAVNRIDASGRGCRYVRRVSGHEGVGGPPAWNRKIANIWSKALGEPFGKFASQMYQRCLALHSPPK